MNLLNNLLTNENKKLREKIIHHAFWHGIESGTLDRKGLALFAKQDYWLVKQAANIDMRLIASVQNRTLKKLLIERQQKQIVSGKNILVDFALSLGITEEELTQTEPLTGCMDLTTFFYWVIDNTSDIEKIMSIDVSKEIFSLLCVKVKPALLKRYGLQESEVAFFTIHEETKKRLEPVDTYLEKHMSVTEKKKLQLVIKLSYEHELLFYDTLLSATLM